MWVVALTPIVGITLPALTPLIFAAAGALGYKAMIDMKEGGDINDALRQRIKESTSVRVQVESMVLEAMEQEVKRAQSLYFEKDGIILSVIKDERGKLRLEATAPEGFDENLLREMGKQFAEELAQLFAQSRAVDELERMNAEVVDEQINEEGDVVLKVTRWT